MCAAHCSKLRKLLSNAWQWYTTDTTSRQLSLRQKSPSLTPRTNQMTDAFVLCFADSARSGSFRFIVINFIYSSIWAESALLRYTCMCINLSKTIDATVCLYYIYLSIYLFVSVFVLLCVYLEIDLNGDCTNPNDIYCKTGLTCDANACSKCGVFNIRENVYA